VATASVMVMASYAVTLMWSASQRRAVDTLLSDTAVVATQMAHVHLWIWSKKLATRLTCDYVLVVPFPPIEPSITMYSPTIPTSKSSCTERCTEFAVIEYRKNLRRVVSIVCWGIATRRKAMRDAKVVGVWCVLYSGWAPV